MNEKFGKLLLNLDLTPTQVKIYLSILRLGLSTVLDISKDTKINRSQIYFDTSILLERGFLELAAKRKRKFLAVQPNKIKRIIEEKNEKLKNLESMLGEATNFYEENKKEKDNFEIRIFEGVEQIKNAYKIEFDETEVDQIYSIVGAVSYQESVLPVNFWKKWNLDFAARGGKGRMIISKQDQSYFNREENKHHCVLQTKGINHFDLKTNIDVWGDKVLTVTYSKKPSAVLVRNKIMADSYKDMFEKLWKLAS
jgi:sugar-specific transcriptional regulator TrmB